MNVFLYVVIAALVLLAIVYVVISLKKKSACNGQCSCCSGCEPDKFDFIYTVNIEGMSCEHCKARVENAFNEIAGCSAEVNLEENRLYLQSTHKFTEDEIKKVVENLGFTYVSYTEK
ncbi:MAG: hypothetical protein E7403_06020 [Ruminococcaceae bacterium]|nr:hypothetical protein [Oscillospiraceae bacterium]